MEEWDRDDLGWVLQPVLGAGLSVDQTRDLLFRVAFDEVVSEVRGTRARTAVADQPDAVRAAWQQMLLRLMLLDPSRADGGEGAGGGLATAGG